MAEGLKGTVDFVGYGVGVPVVLPAGGFVGLLDFAGYPVGAPGGVQEQIAAWKPIYRPRRGR